MLNADNDLHLFYLHMVFIPRINKHLKSWQEAWVKHPLRTEHNLSPEQLWTIGLQRIAMTSSHIAKEVFEDIHEEEGQDFGVDRGGPVPHDCTDRAITVPEIPNPLTRVDMLELQATLLHEESSMQY
ncbi:hypothetical protein GBAR_LOCUS9377 [Geodia barretti]|nr:hypothetical protein GBAR_LOCUS9377 [Geodia barretti]